MVYENVLSGLTHLRNKAQLPERTMFLAEITTNDREKTRMLTKIGIVVI